MTVGELIERLQRLDPSLEARVYSSGDKQFEIREFGLSFRNEKNEWQHMRIPLVRLPHPIVFVNPSPVTTHN